ncbi:hypothetical protein [Streptomyces sp. NPDC093589]|uniref:hypothetical protein n=1 Tax=Streptomyces sp. NPDC093589 TaxID=3366043 RepID=UPI003816AEEF
MDDEHGPVVAAYTWEEAFEGGLLMEIPPAAASAAGLDMPLTITAAARQEFMAGNDGGEDGRLQVVLSAVARAVERGRADEVCFVVPAGELPSGRAPTDADRLIAITELDDAGDPILTLMLPHEM